MILVTKWFGVFLVDKEKQKVVRHLLFEKDPRTIAAKLALVQKGEVLPEEASLAQKRMRVAEPRLSPLGKPEFVDSAFIRPQDYGFSPQLMQRVLGALGKIRTREPLPADRVIVQAVRALDDTIDTINLMGERLHEWYGHHFPELADYAGRNATSASYSRREDGRPSSIPWTWTSSPWGRSWRIRIWRRSGSSPPPCCRCTGRRNDWRPTSPPGWRRPPLTSLRWSGRAWAPASSPSPEGSSGCLSCRRERSSCWVPRRPCSLISSRERGLLSTG